MFRRLLMTVSFLALGAFGTLQAQTYDPQSPQPSNPDQQQQQQSNPDQQSMDQQSSQQAVSEQDREFVERAAQNNMAEIQLGQIAAQRSSNESVKQFAQQLVSDHQKAHDELKQIASGKGISVPADMDSSKKSDQDRLSSMSGAEFDREFVRQQKKDHQETVALFKRQAENGQDPELKSYASRTLESLQQHEQMASNLESQVGGGQGGVGKYGPENIYGPGTTSSYPSSTTNPDVSKPDTSSTSSSSSASTTTSPGSSAAPGSSTPDANRPGSGTTIPDTSSQAAPQSSATSPDTSSQSQSTTSQSTTTSTSTEQEVAGQEESRDLPRTAGNMPLIGLVGLLLLGAGMAIKSYRFLRDNH